jgi:hypothetical protein
VRIDEALAASKALDVQFGSSTLHIMYRPSNYTIAEMEEAESRRAEKGYLVKMIQDLVEAWDLTRVEPILGDDGVQVGEREVPVNVGSAEEVRQYVTRPIIVGILKAIREDGEAGEA